MARDPRNQAILRHASGLVARRWDQSGGLEVPPRLSAPTESPLQAGFRVSEVTNPESWSAIRAFRSSKRSCGIASYPSSRSSDQPSRVSRSEVRWLPVSSTGREAPTASKLSRSRAVDCTCWRRRIKAWRAFHARITGPPLRATVMRSRGSGTRRRLAHLESASIASTMRAPAPNFNHRGAPRCPASGCGLGRR